jgi:hypothetical protein
MTLEVHMGDGGTEVLTGRDSVRLVPYSLTDKSDGGNPVPPNNQFIVVNRPKSSLLIEELECFPMPLRTNLTEESRPVSGPREDGTFMYVLNRGADIEIMIYSLLGVPVFKVTIPAHAQGARQGYNFYYWNGTNSRGRQVGVGAYILIMKAWADDGSSDREKRKIGVVRGRR